MKKTKIIIHCSATRPDWMKSRGVQAKINEITHWHVVDNGWRGNAYQFLIDRTGDVGEGRDLNNDGIVWNETGAHTKGHNSESIGICLIGGHGASENDQFADHFTQAQDDALRKLIADLQAKVGPLTVHGHNEFARKACPGFDVSRWLENKPPRTIAQSTTLIGAATTAASGAGGVATALSRLDPAAQMMVIGCACVAMFGLGWIARERIKKWARGVR